MHKPSHHLTTNTRSPAPVGVPLWFFPGSTRRRRCWRMIVVIPSMIIIMLANLCALTESRPGGGRGGNKPALIGRVSRNGEAAGSSVAEDSSSWWTDTDLESALGGGGGRSGHGNSHGHDKNNGNTLESISRSWQTRQETDLLRRTYLKNASVTCNDGSRAG